MPILCKRDSDTGRFKRVASCDHCQIMVINGVVCHETGCPDAWRDSLRECKECGTEFVPTEQHQDCCDEDCMRSYHNLPSE